MKDFSQREKQKSQKSFKKETKELNQYLQEKYKKSKSKSKLKEMGANKTLNMKKRFGKKIKQNRPLPNWYRYKSDTNIRFSRIPKAQFNDTNLNKCHYLLLPRLIWLNAGCSYLDLILTQQYFIKIKSYQYLYNYAIDTTPREETGEEQNQKSTERTVLEDGRSGLGDIYFV
ncbi:hypothetical protein ABPG72_021646 [Tetrahymena utriculariae]